MKEVLPCFVGPVLDARRAFVGDEHSETRGPVDKDDDRRYETRRNEKRP